MASGTGPKSSAPNVGGSPAPHPRPPNTFPVVCSLQLKHLMTICIDLSKCLPDNTALQIKISLPGISSISLPPEEGRYIRPLLLTTFCYFPVFLHFPAARRSHRMRRHHHHHQHHHQRHHHKSHKERRKHKKHPAEDWEKEEGNFC